MLRRLSTLKTPVRQGAFGISALRSFTNSTRLGATAPELKSNVTDDGGNESKRAGGKSAPNCGPEPTGDHKFGRWTKRLAAITALCVGGAGLVAITEEIQKREKRLIERVEELQRKSERKTEQKYEDFLTGTRFAAWLQTRRNQNESNRIGRDLKN